MAFKVFDPEAKVERDIFFKLVPGGAGLGGVKLIAVDEKGASRVAGNILTISRNGTLVLHSMVNREFGLRLEGEGHLLVGRE